VTLIKDEEINVNRCALPYGLTAEKPIAAFQIPNTLITEVGAELLVDTVVSLDPAAGRVTTACGETVAYGSLLLAAGSRPLIPSIPGAGADNVTGVRTLRDLTALRELTAAGTRAAVVGGGYIGIELAAALRAAGLEVTLIEREDRLLPATSEPELAAVVEEVLVGKGVRVKTGGAVTGFPETAGRAAGADTSDGETVEADFVVLALGVVPNSELAAAAGIPVSAAGIVVDERLRTGAENVYAAGDCATKRSLAGNFPVRGEFGTNAVFMGQAAAENILGRTTVFPGVTNASASAVFGWSIGSAGLTESQAREAGMDVVTGYSEVPDRYPMMAGGAPVRTKLVFDRRTLALAGGSVLRSGPRAADDADFLSFAIQTRATLHDLERFQYATHPELAAKPSDNSIVFACRNALRK
ncbi:MAG TPA: FAD-dependent oxidoreductase, partial [bacterium]|nr:FAD-dependent oxidoreductase [bacterium]